MYELTEENQRKKNFFVRSIGNYLQFLFRVVSFGPPPSNPSASQNIPYLSLYLSSLCVQVNRKPSCKLADGIGGWPLRDDSKKIVWASFNTIYIPSTTAPLVSPELEVIIRLSCDERGLIFSSRSVQLSSKESFSLRKKPLQNQEHCSI